MGRNRKKKKKKKFKKRKSHAVEKKGGETKIFIRTTTASSTRRPTSTLQNSSSTSCEATTTLAPMAPTGGAASPVCRCRQARPILSSSLPILALGKAAGTLRSFRVQEGSLSRSLRPLRARLLLLLLLLLPPLPRLLLPPLLSIPLSPPLPRLPLFLLPRERPPEPATSLRRGGIGSRRIPSGPNHLLAATRTKRKSRRCLPRRSRGRRKRRLRKKTIKKTKTKKNVFAYVFFFTAICLSLSPVSNFLLTSRLSFF